jgi:hypothetical protein
MTTATPSGFSASRIQSDLMGQPFLYLQPMANASTTRAICQPVICPLGIYATCALTKNGISDVHTMNTLQYPSPAPFAGSSHEKPLFSGFAQDPLHPLGKKHHRPAIREGVETNPSLAGSASSSLITSDKSFQSFVFFLFKKTLSCDKNPPQETHRFSQNTSYI